MTVRSLSLLCLPISTLGEGRFISAVLLFFAHCQCTGHEKRRELTIRLLVIGVLAVPSRNGVAGAK